MVDPATILLEADPPGSVPIIPVFKGDPEVSRPDGERRWLAAAGFTAEAGQHALAPGEDGSLARVYYGLGGEEPGDRFAFGKLARSLPERVYRLEGALPDSRLAALAWLLESYRFEAYRKPGPTPATLVCPAGVDRDGLLAAARAHYFVRDLVNTPSSDLGPKELEDAARGVAARHGARLSVTMGGDLERDFPMVAAVGRASARAPRLVDFAWGNEADPKVTIVGKGVCFDTGGLDIKPSAGMLLMKKDMGGAAHALALADLIMTVKLRVRLRVLIPAVENAISGNAFRPGDVLRSRKGLTVEIGNTDAEGRLILADALALADEESPELLVDFATLTGAARVALGPDLPPFYTDDDNLAQGLIRAAEAENDPVWRMPFWRPYYSMIESGIADINNASEGGFAGSVTAALFLRKFVGQASSYLHFDVFAWTPVAKPGRPKGGEAQGIRALFAVLRDRYTG
jgi:leucyl aminopeptidase